MNYKDAYLYTFNELTDLIAQIKKIQRTAEYICIASDSELSVKDFLDETKPISKPDLPTSSETA